MIHFLIQYLGMLPQWICGILELYYLVIDNLLWLPWGFLWYTAFSFKEGLVVQARMLLEVGRVCENLAAWCARVACVWYTCDETPSLLNLRQSKTAKNLLSVEVVVGGFSRALKNFGWSHSGAGHIQMTSSLLKKLYLVVDIPSQDLWFQVSQLSQQIASCCHVSLNSN